MFASFDPFSISSEVPTEIDNGTIIPPNGSTPNTTHALLHKVLVTNVQLEQLPDVDQREGIGDEEDRDVRLAPQWLRSREPGCRHIRCRALLFAKEFGLVWLSIEPETAIEEPSIIQSRGTVYQELEDILELLDEDTSNG